MNEENLCECGHDFQSHGYVRKTFTLTRPCEKCPCSSFHRQNARKIIKKTSEQENKSEPKLEKKEHRHLLQTLGISEDDYKNDEIIQLLVDGHGEKYKIMGYEKTLSPDPKIFPIKDLKGKVAVLQFTASWCSVCRQEMPHLEKDVWQKFKVKDFILIGVDRDEPLDVVQKFTKFALK